ncbi:hypothetical protein AAFX91_20045 [Bradyrhizobium sp. 31Argb]|uniref:hypothetical protein n=1 Tax=Bradyrhizobium sp. 31Argb TaxID=3141247 RepID=UPI0037494DC0
MRHVHARRAASSQVWGEPEFKERETLWDAERLTRELLERLIAEGLPQESATQDYVDTLYRCWPLPMYNVDLSPVHVTLDALKAEQDRLYWAEVGAP